MARPLYIRKRNDEWVIIWRVDGSGGPEWQIGRCTTWCAAMGVASRASNFERLCVSLEFAARARGL